MRPLRTDQEARRQVSQVVYVFGDLRQSLCQLRIMAFQLAACVRHLVAQVEQLPVGGIEHHTNIPLQRSRIIQCLAAYFCHVVTRFAPLPQAVYQRSRPPSLKPVYISVPHRVIIACRSGAISPPVYLYGRMHPSGIFGYVCLPYLCTILRMDCTVEISMSSSNVTMALAKVMVAEAWSDGRVTVEEINCLKDLLFQLPGMTARDWDQLDIYLDSPVGAAERERLVEELHASLKSGAEKEQVLRALDILANADGVMTPEEIQTLDEIRGIIQGSGTGLSGKLGRFMGHSLNRRASSLENAPNRERYLEDFVRNKIYYSVSRRLEQDGSSIDLPDAELRKLSLAGGLMARVAYVDQQVEPAELTSIVQAIEEQWHTSELQSALIAEVAVSEIGKGMDYFRLSREFFENTSEAERITLFRPALFCGRRRRDGIQCGD